ncbi:hypothetical protein SAMN05421849_1427 [Pontibaca methylaminivorans]|uniref:Uncharacterized protein n=1 Tax=Pontibaca methylaminivorans TaxID=515897 RepID=A0A1R3WU52_9RHOB|nr:hypothetical protein SAMN05421849_1427 [Pontibaca methylaminivorans]
MPPIRRRHLPSLVFKGRRDDWMISRIARRLPVHRGPAA